MEIYFIVVYNNYSLDINLISNNKDVVMIYITTLYKEKILMKFFKCNDCENIILELFNKENGKCDLNIKEISVGTVDAALEKHVPYVVKDDDKLKIQIGEVEHPMVSEHYIPFIIIEKRTGFELFNLKPGDRPYIEIDKKDVVTVYEFCNLHGIWKTDL